MKSIRHRILQESTPRPTRLTAVAESKGRVELAKRLVSELSAGEIESRLGAVLECGARAASISGVSIDSRTIAAGELFFAIRGPRTDGHDWIEAALGRGAAGAVVSGGFVRPPSFPADRLLLRVDDTHRALKRLAASVRGLWRGSLVGITGSMGKTTTKEFTAHVLEGAYRVYRSPGNYNNLFGLPLSLLGVHSDDQIGVFEMGMSAPGEIAEMCRIARPGIGILTSVAPVHLEFFRSLDEIAQAKGELAESLGEGDTLVYNGDDPHVRAIAARARCARVSFGFGPDADVRADEVEIRSLDETRFRLTAFGETRRAVLPLGGRHYIYNALPGVALARRYRVPFDEIVESLRDLRQAAMRGRVVRFAAGFTVIDDSYNSNPAALALMIDTVAALPHFARRIVVAGEMLELGPAAGRFHHEAGEQAARAGVDLLVGVQGAAEELVRGARAAGMTDRQARFFADASTAAEFLAAELKDGDLALVKGSRGVHLERVVALLRERYEEAAG